MRRSRRRCIASSAMKTLSASATPTRDAENKFKEAKEEERGPLGTLDALLDDQLGDAAVDASAGFGGRGRARRTRLRRLRRRVRRHLRVNLRPAARRPARQRRVLGADLRQHLDRHPPGCGARRRGQHPHPDHGGVRRAPCAAALRRALSRRRARCVTAGEAPVSQGSSSIQQTRPQCHGTAKIVPRPAAPPATVQAARRKQNTLSAASRGRRPGRSASAPFGEGEEGVRGSDRRPVRRRDDEAAPGVPARGADLDLRNARSVSRRRRSAARSRFRRSTATRSTTFSWTRRPGRVFRLRNKGIVLCADRLTGDLGSPCVAEDAGQAHGTDKQLLRDPGDQPRRPDAHSRESSTRR